MKKEQLGFTLVELAVVVFLIGLLASVGLSALNAQLANASISTTKKKQEVIKDALIAYLGKYKRLPCPAIDNSGQESRVTANTPANCTGYFGFVPYATLGLPKNTALDGWEDFFSYAVSSQWTLSFSTAAPVAGGTSTNAANAAFNTGITGAFVIKDRSTASPYSAVTINSNAVALIVSHGKNGLGALTAKGTTNVSPPTGTDELANATTPATWVTPSAFYQREYTDIDNGGHGTFDDVIQWLSPNDLITPLIKDGALKSAEAQWAEQIANINSALVGAMFNDSRCAPPLDQTAFTQLLTANGVPAVDPWGGALTYSRNFCRLHNDGRYKTSNCSSDCGGGGCISPSTSFIAYTVTTSTTAPVVTIRPQTLSALTGTNSTLLSGCPSP